MLVLTNVKDTIKIANVTVYSAWIRSKIENKTFNQPQSIQTEEGLPSHTTGNEATLKLHYRKLHCCHLVSSLFLTIITNFHPLL